RLYFRQCWVRSRNGMELASAMIRDNDRSCTLINSLPCIIAGQNSFDHDRARPDGSDPLHVLPSECFRPRSRAHNEEGDRALAWDDYVGQFGNASIKQEANEPSRTREQLRQKRDLIQW